MNPVCHSMHVTHERAMTPFKVRFNPGQSISPARNREEVHRPLPRLSERLAQSRDVDLQIVLFDDGAWPDLFEDRVFRHFLSVRLRQHSQHLERAGFERDFDCVAEKLPVCQV